MDKAELRKMTAEAIGKDPLTAPENPQWDSLDKLEIITHLHEALGDRVNQVKDLDDFTDLNELYDILHGAGIVD